MVSDQSFKSSIEHVLAELERIELLVRSQVNCARLQFKDHEFRGLVISDDELDTLLQSPIGYPHLALAETMHTNQKVVAHLASLTSMINSKVKESVQLGIRLRLLELQQQFSLTSFELNVVLICLGPELDLKYDRLYAYLQDDVTKKRPSIGLVLNLLCMNVNTRIQSRQSFQATAPLVHYRLLNIFEDPTHHHPPLLSKFLKLDERVANFLLDVDGISSDLNHYAALRVPSEHHAELSVSYRLPFSVDEWTPLLESQISTVFYFQGISGIEKESTANSFCQQCGVNMLVVDGGVFAKNDYVTQCDMLLRIVRETKLENSAIYWKNFDALLEEDKSKENPTFTI